MWGPGRSALGAWSVGLVTSLLGWPHTVCCPEWHPVGGSAELPLEWPVGECGESPERNADPRARPGRRSPLGAKAAPAGRAADILRMWSGFPTLSSTWEPAPAGSGGLRFAGGAEPVGRRLRPQARSSSEAGGGEGEGLPPATAWTQGLGQDRPLCRDPRGASPSAPTLDRGVGQPADRPHGHCCPRAAPLSTLACGFRGVL